MEHTQKTSLRPAKFSCALCDEASDSAGMSAENTLLAAYIAQCDFHLLTPNQKVRSTLLPQDMF